MLDLTAITFQAFREEVKTASLQGALSGLGAGAGLGALAGGAAGAYRGYRQAKSRGESGVDAFLGAAKGVPKGMAVGGGLGAAAGAGAGALSPQLGARLAQTQGIGAPVRFAQRQVHGLTGWTPEAGIESIGGGAAAAKAHLARMGSKATARDHAGAAAAVAAQEAGLTSLPGFARALAKDPKGALRKGFNEQWHTQSPGMKALTLGMPALEAAHAMTSEDTPGGQGKGERVGRSLLPALSGLVTGGLPLTSQLAVSGAIGAAGAGAGRLVDRLRGRPALPAAPPPHPAEATSGTTFGNGGAV